MKFFLTTSVILAAVFLAQPEPEDLNIDFRGGRLPQADVHFFGAEANTFITPEDNGLRILIPASDKPGLAVGIEANVELQGDFEITSAYEVVQMDKPQKGNGPGVTLSIQSAGSYHEFIAFAYRNHPVQGDIFLSNKGLGAPVGRNPGDSYRKPAQAAGKSGKLRLTRSGSTVIFSTAQLKDDDFKELYRSVFVADPVHQVRVSADVDKEMGRLDVRIYSFQIRHIRSAIPSAAPSSTVRWLTIGAVAIGGVMAAAYAGWRLLRKSPA